jgi:hypothetical protein
MRAATLLVICLVMLACSARKEYGDTVIATPTISWSVSDAAEVSLCDLARYAETICVGSVKTILPPIEIASTEAYSGGVFTPIVVEAGPSLKGVVVGDQTLHVTGYIGPRGESIYGPVEDNRGLGMSAYFFVVRTLGRPYVEGGGGFFWRAQGVLKNSARYRRGLPEQAFVADVDAFKNATTCPGLSGNE